MNAPTTAPHTIVVGGGLAGLTAANLLIDRGHQVTVLEARHRLGGRATTDDRAGHLFNQGPHALYRGGPAQATLTRLGVATAGAEPPSRGSLALSGGRLGPLPRGARSLLATRLFSPADKVVIGRVLGALGHLDPTALIGRTAEDWVGGLTDRPRVRDLMRAVIRLATYCTDLDRLSAPVALHQVQLGVAGVLYADGGWQRLIDQLADRAREAGAVIGTGVSVRAVAAGDREVAVDTGEGRHTADAVVLAGLAPALAAQLTGSPALAAFADRAVPVRAATLDVGLRRLPRPDQPFALGLDRPLYLSVHNPPADLGSGVTLHVMAYLPGTAAEPNGDTDTEGAGGARGRRAELEAFLEQVQPGWRQELETIRYQHQLVVSHAVPEPSATGRGPARPGVDGAGRPGVYVAGDWVGAEGHLADAAVASAVAAAEAADAWARAGRPPVAVPAAGAQPGGAV